MRHRGFTLMELLLVLLLVAVVASFVGPMVTGSVERAKEATLKENLFVLRKALDDYYADNGGYPQELSALVEKRYIRSIPLDPITEKRDWRLKRASNDSGEGGIIDVKSNSEKTPYNEW